METEELALQKPCHLNSLLEQLVEVIQEKETGDKVILILHHVFNDDLNSTNLVVSQRAVNGRTIEELILVISLHDLVLVEHWEVRVEEFGELVIQDVFHRSTIEAENGGHIGTIKLEETLVEDLRIILAFD